MTESDRYILKLDWSKYYANVKMRNFTIEYGGRKYILKTYPWTTLDLAWVSEKCWFMPGSIVTITDDKGNSKTFVKEQ